MAELRLGVVVAAIVAWLAPWLFGVTASVGLWPFGGVGVATMLLQT